MEKYRKRTRIRPEGRPLDETDFDRNYIPEYLAEKVRNRRNLSAGERLVLTNKLSVAAWAKIGVVRDSKVPRDKATRRVSLSHD
jgi:hypothetical protein